MKNLENLNLVELNAREKKETQGGFLIEYHILVLGGAFALGFYNGYHAQN